MKKMMKLLQPVPLGRLLPLLLALVLLCGACVMPPAATEAPTAAPPTAAPAPTQAPAATEAPAATKVPAATEAPAATAVPAAAHPNIPFSEMAYERPDTDALTEKLNALIADAQAEGGGTDALLDRFDEALADFNAASSALSLCYVYYAHDVSDAYYRDEYAELLAALNRIDLLMTDAALALLERGDGLALARWGEDFAAAVEAGDKLNDEAIQPLLEQEQALVQEYDDLIASFVLEENGRTYTMEQIVSVAAEDYEEYVRLYDAYTAQLNEQAGAIFLELLALRSDIAAKLGYGSYAAYGYDLYGRDFTVTDAQALHAAVKEHLAPLFQQYTLLAVYAERSMGERAYPLEEYFETLREVTADFSPLMREALDYMIDYGLYDFEANENKMEMSFTTYFSAYASPFMFTAWEDSMQNTSTVIHELGHFANYYHSPVDGWSVSSSLDLAEVDSQGFELLMMPYLPQLYGSDEVAEAAAISRLADALYAVVSGCMEDEFQQAVYADPDMTLEQMNALYRRLAEEYGLADLYGYTGTEWAMIPHTFQSPMYYISYATSMVAAFELWTLSLTDADAARTAYLNILQRGAYAKFRETLSANGLGDPLSPATIESIAAALS